MLEAAAVSEAATGLLLKAVWRVAGADRPLEGMASRRTAAKTHRVRVQREQRVTPEQALAPQVPREGGI